MSENRGFHCKRYISRVAFRPPEGDFPQDPRPFVAMVDDRDAVLWCNRVERHEHEWPDDYSPVNPTSR